MKYILSNKSYIPVELSIMNSQPEFNFISNGNELLTEEDLHEEHEEHKETKERYLISVEGEYIGIIDFIMENPKDHKPWLGLFILHKKWEGRGLAQEAYDWYSEQMKSRKVKGIRLGCLKENERGLAFWRKQQYEVVKEIEFKDRPMFIMEKQLVL